MTARQRSRPDEDRDLEGGLDGLRAERSLVGSLAETVDEARQLVADLGFRPYRVRVVVEGWTGGEVGRGRVEVVSEREIVPPPEVDLRPVRREYGATGSVERGEVTLRRISPRYTEEQVRAIFQPTLAEGQTAYVEVQEDGRWRSPADPARRRRYVVSSAPWRDAARFEWVVRLRPQDDARTPSGRPRGA